MKPTSPIDLRDAPFKETLRVPLVRPVIDEREASAAAEVVRTGMLCQGEKTAEFERLFAEMLNAPHAIAVSSGSTALLVAMQAMGIGPGDEVIVPDMTFVSTATAAMYLGAKPVLADITGDDFNIDPTRVERLITSKTKLIVPVHYAGATADMAALQAIATKHKLLILEDAAEAHLARYEGNEFAGTIGDVGIFSFTPTKPMTTGEGGMIVTHRADFAEKCRRIRNFGDSGKFQWDVLGFNFRMNEVAAALGLCQLERLAAGIEERRKNAAYFDAGFAEEPCIVTPTLRHPLDGNYQLYTVRLLVDRLTITRDQVIAELAKAGIASRLYYPSLHQQKVFAPIAIYRDEDFLNAIEFQRSALSLPVFPGLTPEEKTHIVNSLLAIVRTHQRPLV